MNFTTTAGQLRYILNTARLATPTNPTLLNYSGNYFYVKDDILNITGADGETFFIAHCKVNDSTNGSLLLNTKNLLKLVSALKSDDIVKLAFDSDNDLLSVMIDGKNYSFRTMVGIFPPTPFPVGESFDVDISKLKEIISIVKKSANKENSYAELKIEDGKLQINTTDNYRLSHAIVENSNIKNINGVLPIAVLEKITKFDIKKITLDADGRTILFSSPDVEIITRLLNQKFPDITNFIKNVPTKIIKIERDIMVQALTRLESLVDTDNTNLNVIIADNEIKLLVDNVDIGTGVEIINSLEQKHDFSFNINLLFIKDAFESLENKNVEIRFESEHKPIYILEENNNNIVHIISPIKK